MEEPALRGDVRGRRVAIVPDSVINPPADAPDWLSHLAAQGWGVIGLPPRELEQSAEASSLRAVVEEVVTFLDADYEVALVASEDLLVKDFVCALRAAGRTLPSLKLEANDPPTGSERPG